jgi:hypothetical protein
MSVAAQEYFRLVLTSLNLTQAWFRCTLAASWFSVAIASFLLALRGEVIHGRTFSRGGCRLTFHQKSRIAIWGRDKYITTVTVLIWSANIFSSFWSAFDRFFAFYFLDLISGCWFMQVLQR